MRQTSGALWSLAVLAAATALAVALWVALWGESPHASGPARGEPTEGMRPTDLDEVLDDPTDVANEAENGGPMPVDSASISERVRPSAVVLEGRVLTSEGKPVENALLTWTALDLESALPALATTAERREELSKASPSTRSNSEGRFQFDLVPGGAAVTSVLWTTAFGMEGNAVPIEMPANRPVEVRLTPGTKRDVRVVNSAGVPVAGAQVEQYSFGALDRAYGDPWKAAAAQAFRRTAVTGADGRPEPAFFSANGGERLRAWNKGISSNTWSETLVDDGQTIELELSASFTCFGQVTCADPSIDLSGLVVDAWTTGEPTSGSLAAAEVRADGSWGPLEVPCRDGWEYGLALDGVGIASDVSRIGARAAGDTIRQDFEAVRELVLLVEIIDHTGVPIPNALCRAQWMSVNYGVAAQSSSDVNGLVRLYGVRPGWVQLLAEAEGYSNYQGEWIELAPPLEEPVRIEMSPSRRVRGRVVREGGPVEIFKIVWWTAQSIRSSQTWDFDVKGSEDGVFELESAPRETVWLMASAEGSSRSGFARSEAESEAEVVLELLPSCRAIGRVVDARNGGSIGGASVQLYMNRGNQYLQPRHAPVVTNADGHFSVDGLAPGDNRLVIEAPGYSRYLGVAFGSPDRVTDIGAVPMQSTRELALVLVSDAPVDAGAYSARLKGTRYHGPIGFDSTGVAQFEDVSPGITTWTVSGPGGFERSEVHTLQPDADWIFEVEVDSGPALEIEVVSPTEAPLPRGLVFVVTGAEPRGPRAPGAESWFTVRADDEGRAQVRGLPPGPVAVLAIDEAGNTGAASHGVLEPGGSRIEVPWSPRVHDFRVLDPAGRPVQEADVFLCAPEGGSTWTTMDATDDNGEVGFALLPYDDVLVGAKHPELGMLPARPLRLSQERGTTILRYGEIAGLDLLLLEGGVPSAGTQVSLFTGGFRFVVGDIASDGEGRLRWPNLAEGTYSMRVVHPGFWPGHAQVPTAKGSEPTPVTIYRSASAVLNVVSAGNSPLAGQEIELEHVGLGEGPAKWAALGLLDSGATVSDAQGRIEIAAWPRGTYRWRAQRPDGAPTEGQFELGPGTNPEIELRVP